MSRSAVVTGCSSGFGRQVSERLARAGGRVYATMRGTTGKNETIARELQALAAAEGLDRRVLELDVTSTSSVDSAVATVLAESGAPDVVVNNAGQMFVGLAEAFSPDEFTKQLDVNVVGIHRVSRAFLPAMRRRGRGLIVNLSSTAGRVGLPFFSVYHASKWAVEGYSMALRMKPGTRPFRSVVGVDFGVRELNASVAPHETALLENLGLTSFATLVRPS